MKNLIDVLPPLYSQWFPDLLKIGVPEEKKATCSSCAMCEQNCDSTVQAVDGKKRFFHPDTKCCTYFPKLPNYLVGAILSDSSPEMKTGRKLIQKRIQEKIGTSPLGVYPPPDYNLKYSSAQGFFGKSPSMICPYYESTTGGCNIWKYRESVCSTWFCKYDQGEDGRLFWGALKAFLTLSEIQLSRYAVLELLPEFILSRKDGSPSTNLTLDDLENRAPDEDSRFEQWGLWIDREEEFYRECYARVKALSTQSFASLLGLDGTVWTRILTEKYERAFSTKLPLRLKLNPAATSKWLPDGTVALASYSEYDAVALPRAAFDLLTRLQEKDQLQVNRDRWRSELKQDLSDEMLLTLYQHRILIEG